MTKQVRTAYRRHRRATVVVVLLALAAGLVFAVYPASGAGNVPSTQGVTPTTVSLGGQSGDCAAVGSQAQYEFRIVNPSTSTFTDPATGATFSLAVTGGNQTLAFQVVGGGAFTVDDLVVKGGTKSSHYDYIAAGKPVVTSDSNLHAPPKGQTYYSISHISFCYDEAVADIGGHVWNDKDEDGTQDAFEGDQAGFLITATAPGKPTRTGTTDANGDYLIEDLPIGPTYTVCESDPGASPPDGWVQSVPTQAVCTGDTPKGYQFQLLADSLQNDFGNTHTVSDACGDARSVYEVGDDTISVSACTKEGDIEYVFETWEEVIDGKLEQVVNFHPVPGSCTNCGTASTIERLTWSIDKTQNSVLRYDDDLTDGVAPVDMLYCNGDPRSGNPADPYELGPNPSAVLPAGHTSCLIESTERADETRVDWVFSEIDGYRTLD